mgnify:CR=1 FL=1
MNNIYKVYSVILRKIIFLLDGVNNRIYTKLYCLYLKKRGVQFNGMANYISSSAYLDGQGLNIIKIGKDVVISREAMLLTHDYSVETSLHSDNKGSMDRHIHINNTITIGDNSFIGARASLLPGTNIGKNCIIGACAVVKGNIPDGKIVVGNPGKIVGETKELYKKYKKLGMILGDER